MRIWKFPLVITDSQAVPLPQGAVILDVQMQHGECCLWALCDETAPVVHRAITIFGTGHPMPDNPGKYVATFQTAGGMVFHVFELE